MIADYQESFESDPLRYGRQLREVFQSGLLQQLPTCYRPLFLSHDDHQHLERISLALAGELSRLWRAELRESEERAVLGLDSRLLPYLESDAPTADPQGSWRFDFCYWPFSSQRPGQALCLECNAGDPSGMGYVDTMSELFEAFAPLVSLRDRYALSSAPLLAAHRRMLERRYRSFFEVETAPRSVAFLCPSDSSVRLDHEAMAEQYQKAGWDATVGDPREFRFDGVSLTLKGNKVDLIWRDELEDMVYPPYDSGGHQVAEAYRCGKVCLLNPLCSIFADSKALFEPLSRGALAEHVPWTRVVGAASPLSEYEQKRSSLVLKPNQGFGGHQVLVGAAASHAQWCEALSQAARQPGGYVVQQYYRLPQESFPSFDNKGNYLGFQPAWVTLSCWVHDGEFGGAFARAGAHRVVNVHKGGSLMPVYFREAA